MGLERTASVLQAVDSNYHIDILRPIVEAAAEVCQLHYEPESENGRRLRRIADHVRACTFAIHENVYPGPNKEKYVIRRLLRRAVLDGHQMARREPFLYQLVPTVAAMMKGPYPELSDTAQRVASVIQQEEKAFFGTIDDGLQRIERIFDSMHLQDRAIIDGAEAAELYQTYGVPAELFESLAAERGFTFDWTGFRQAMEAHGEASGKVVHTVMGHHGPIDAIKKAVKETRFVGYETTEVQAEVKGVVRRQQLLQEVREVAVRRDVAGGTQTRHPSTAKQVDRSAIRARLVGKECRLRVVDTQRDGELVLHHCQQLQGRIAVGMTVRAAVDSVRREAIRRAHSATHILHYALQKNLGSHAQQQGSKVSDDWLRFDFTNMSPVSAEELDRITQDVREQIQARGDPVGHRTFVASPGGGSHDAVRRKVPRSGPHGFDGPVQSGALRWHPSDQYAGCGCV